MNDHSGNLYIRSRILPWVVEDIEHALGGQGVGCSRKDAHVHTVTWQHGRGRTDGLAARR